METRELKLLLEKILLDEQNKLLSIAERLGIKLTEEDLLQPNDFPLLENHPEFRFQEGILQGIKTALFYTQKE